MEGKVRNKLFNFISLPKDAIIKCMLKNQDDKWVTVSSPMKHLNSGSIITAHSESSSPRKYNRLQTLLSKIEENWEGDEGSHVESEPSESSSESDNENSKKNLTLIQKFDPQQFDSTKTLVNSQGKNSIYSEKLAIPCDNWKVLNLRYEPIHKNALREEFKYPSFDAYFHSNYKVQESDEEFEGRSSQSSSKTRNKFVQRFNLMEEAENFLINLGEILLKFRNLEDDQKISQPQIILKSQPKPLISHPKRSLKKRKLLRN